MWFSSWIRKLGAVQGLPQPRPGRRAPYQRAVARYRPRLEALEDRFLPSTLTVLSTADSGAGSLRAAIASAQDGDTIMFDHGLNGLAISVTSGELVIDKSLSIEGPGNAAQLISGNNASRVFNITNAAAILPFQ